MILFQCDLHLQPNIKECVCPIFKNIYVHCNYNYYNVCMRNISFNYTNITLLAILGSPPAFNNDDTISV